MFSAAIQNAKALADEILRQPGDTHTAQVIADVRSFSADQVPKLTTLAQDSESFAQTAAQTVAQMLSKIEAGQTPASLKNDMDTLRQDANSLEGRGTQTNAGLATFRNTFIDDAGTLQQQLPKLEANLKTQQAAARKAQIRARDLQHEINQTNALLKSIPVVGAVAKLVSELKSLISEKKTTEEAFSDAMRKAATLQRQIHMLHASIAEIEHMSGLLDQLTGGTQGIVNVINMISGNLNNEAQFLTDAPNAAKLYLTALHSTIEQLSDLVS